MSRIDKKKATIRSGRSLQLSSSPMAPPAVQAGGPAGASSGAKGVGDGFVTGRARAVDTKPAVLNKDIVCPVMGAIVGEGRIKLDENGRLQIKDLTALLKNEMGTTNGLAAVFMAVGLAANRPQDILNNLMSMSFNPLTMREGMIKHPGDSAILTEGKFDEQKFQALTKYAKNGRMTLDDISKAITSQAERDADQEGVSRGTAIDVVEFSALMNILGKTDPKTGERYMEVGALRDLYQHKKLPPASDIAARERTGVGQLLQTMVKIAKGLPLGGAAGLALTGLNRALDANPVPPSAMAIMGAGKGRCPGMQGASPKPAPALAGGLEETHQY